MSRTMTSLSIAQQVMFLLMCIMGQWVAASGFAIAGGVYWIAYYMSGGRAG